MNLPFNDAQKMNEIIFANRNKKYGAYAIRNSYNVTLLRALIIISFSVFLFAALAYSLSTREEVIKHDPDGNLTDSIRVVEFTTKVEDPPSPPEPKKKVTPPPGNDDPQATVIRDSAANRPIALNVDLGRTNNTDTSGTGPEIPGRPGTGTNTGAPVTFTIAPSTTTFAVVDDDPEFEGGADALRKFLRDNVVYPTLAREAGIEGTVHVSFVVEETGKVGAVKVLRGVGGGCTEEAVRVVGKIPPFKKPGRMSGIAVRCWFNVPISFRLR